MNIDLGESTDFQVLQNTLELSNKRVVDIGCGKGEFAAAIAGLNGERLEVADFAAARKGIQNGALGPSRARH